MNFICFDTEDDSKELLEAGKSGFDKTVTQIAAMTAEGKQYYSPGNLKHFLKWLERQPETFIYSLNIGYDLGNLFGDKLDTLDVVMVGGRMIRANWRNKTFVDVFNIWPMSVKKLGEAFNLAKLETSSMATDRAYVMRDVEIIREAMLFAWTFANENGIDRLPATLGGLCVKLWQHWGGENSHDSNELSRAALFGGRVELFKAHNDTPDVCWTDINSLYPFVMQKEFPASCEDWGNKLAPYGVARVTVKVPKRAICVLPFRNDEGRIYYPWGHFTGTWTVVELNAAVARGTIIENVEACWGTAETEKPYGGFVRRCYDLRLRSQTPAEKLFYKLLMNNLYGRLGASGVIGRTVWQDEMNCGDGVPYGDKVLINYHLPLSAETNWLHAAHVTAYGRLELLKYLELIGADKMIYCDTDSAIFDCPGRQIPFPIGAELGAMKLESWETNCEPFAPKLYRAGNKYKAKGIPVRLAKQFIETGKASFDLPFKFREAARFYDERRDAKGAVTNKKNSHKLSVWRTVTKEKRSDYDKKILKNNRYFPCKIIQTA
jgi:hypothetical protein